ncbi:class I SAM-dependent methyltransferase [Pseudalkalibacillus berkeleyi]|uniref:Class I SAM-dependent methyltransferase n=1 Tax=Pseudalkalibacillus berkeleyi TaxID=1069813 RepID=A0ABS9GZW1_9BACL|nr:class I SAM-dependent methyltransferase [Pseudalkalibacillus berkeleyi]MCF6138282.1 class I SAM-dependent methyltransferase [Pseudalkalibacillus berkeleyi]
MEKVIEYYKQFDEWGRLDRQPIEFQVNLHYIKKYLPSSGAILDNGAGPGKYSMELARSSYEITLTDLTPKSVEDAKRKAKEFNLTEKFDGFHVADARNLKVLSNQQFDAALMLGPLYHIQEERDRIQAVKELYRVTKNEGLVFVAFMPRVRHIFTSLQFPENWRPNNSMDAINRFDQTGCFNHLDEGRFTGAYYFNIEDIQPFMESIGFKTIELIGSNVGASLSEREWNYWWQKGEQEKLLELLIEKARDPYLLGSSSHLLYIGKKKG